MAPPSVECLSPLNAHLINILLSRNVSVSVHSSQGNTLAAVTNNPAMEGYFSLLTYSHVVPRFLSPKRIQGSFTSHTRSLRTLM